MRQAMFAGSFYASNEPALLRQLEACFFHEKGPGDLPADNKQGFIDAVIVPHAGYQYSGPCAAWAYKALAESENPDLFILLGTSHRSVKSGFSMETVETPLGLVRVHQDFARTLSEKGHLKQKESIFEGEHSLEVQLPFLQFIYRKKPETLKVLPILVSEDLDFSEAAVDIKETLIEMGLKATFIVSSDFTHFGSAFHYVPFSDDLKKNIYDLDRGAIELIKKKDVNGFLEYVDKTLITICGVYPIALLLRLVNSENVLLEQYYASGDLSGDYNHSVSYASFVFK